MLSDDEYMRSEGRRDNKDGTHILEWSDGISCDVCDSECDRIRVSLESS